MRRKIKQEGDKNIQFSELLRQRKIKFQRDQRALDKVFSNKLGKQLVIIINPQRFPQQTAERRQPTDVQSSNFHKKSQQNSIQELQQQSYDSPKLREIKREYLLGQKARNFIQRLRKQKQYNQGKYLFLRKKEDQRRQQQRLKAAVIKQEIRQYYNRKKAEKIMRNIMLHEQRISFRVDQSVTKGIRKSHVRSKTENAVRSESVRESVETVANELPRLQRGNRKIANIHTINQ